MLWKILLGLAAIFSHNSSPELRPETEYVPTEYGPQTAEEAEIARNALHNNNLYGGDIKFPDGWNETDAGMKDERFRWPGYPGRAVIPFVLDRSVYGIRNVIYEGMQHYHRYTCIRFKERTNERDFIRIFYGDGCWSIIGRNGGQQNLSLGNGCAWVGLVIHELGHAIGLFHEHQRSDRDNYITVYRNNVIPGNVLR
ncbi:zinc metalloproteinase nas-6 [Trichonephila inaurata madagascariensis]|uniref:Metalloendopeptidase n=1 Tax=Trichonephila inaurata madagascariensis TaxID=2747483 RepID=A0A8X6XIR2_9ARAC|nr:zinc metalloproteinase nas-6 [Trichonephila inaurata madagascariensis]